MFMEKKKLPYSIPMLRTSANKPRKLSCGDGSNASGTATADNVDVHWCADGSSVTGGIVDMCESGTGGIESVGCLYGNSKANLGNCADGVADSNFYCTSTCSTGGGEGKTNSCFSGTLPQS
jgi:hypothetical protein